MSGVLGFESELDVTTGFAVGAVLVAAIVCAAGIASARRSGRKLLKEHLLLEGALNNMVQGLCMFDADDRLVMWNQRYVDMYKFGAGAIWVGCSSRDLLNARIAAGTFPLDRDGYVKKLYEALGEGRSFILEIELNDGRVMAVVNQPMPNGGWVATHEDITDRRRAGRELERTRNFLDMIIENVPSPIIVKDVPALRYRFINRAAETYLGVGRDAMLGKSLAEVMPDEASIAVIDAEERKLIATGQAAVLDEHLVATPGNGSRIVNTARLPVMGEDGKPKYLITVIRDLTERKRHEQQIEHLSHHDLLTDLPNRAAFNERLDDAISGAAAKTSTCALLMFDIDGFKSINDVYGQETGDAILRLVGERVGKACDGAFLARVGGDEFAVIAPEGPQPQAAMAFADRIVAAFDRAIEVNGYTLKAGVSIGVAIYPQDGGDSAALVANVDVALEHAKEHARGSIRFFEPETDRQLREERALQQDLALAISRGEIDIHYQPQARMDGGIVGFEALARWHHPVRGIVPPGRFIPIAEESGSIIEIGEWILRRACEEAASWPNDLSVAVNLSPVQFQHGDLPKLVHEVLLQTGLPAARLELEITESVLIDDLDHAVGILRQLKNLGVRIAMDDFGTGYSSLSYLQAFPFDKIKIDKGFISKIDHCSQSATIVRAVIALGRELSLPVLAEGVETEQQLRFLADESCDGIQGYYIGRPMPIGAYGEVVGRAPEAKPSHAIR
ncbi:MAG TPA: EAL domain-containing protein [Pseudolabrys sp.]|jgi:diguanylate cyclase (GGDEF)-like protein/PAS domain S-box-containing protein|nr:EAL domain-containing protein [Pseudolabrys sp.]